MAARLLVAASLLVWLGASSGWPTADAEMRSQNYRVDRDVLNFGGGEGQSPSWVNFGSLGEVAAGLSLSANYAVNAGMPAQLNTSLTIAVDSATASFGTATPGTPLDAATVVTVTTDAAAGYSLAAQYSGPLSSGSDTVADFAGTVAAPVAWSGTGFGFTVSAGTAVEAKWSSGAAYAAFSTTAAEIHAPAPTPGVPDATTVSYRVDVPTSQASGAYATTVTYTAAATL